MRKTLLIASIPLSFIGGYIIGRKKYKKLFHTVCDISKDEFEDYKETFEENRKLTIEISELLDKNISLDCENARLEEEIYCLESNKEDVDKIQIILKDFYTGVITRDEFIFAITELYKLNLMKMELENKAKNHE